MAEKGQSKPSSVANDALFWAHDGSGNDTDGAVVNAPDGVRKAAGFSTTLADRPTASEVNWLLRELTKAAAWLGAAIVRSFDEVADAFVDPEVAVGELFVVERSPEVFGTTVDTTQGAAGAVTIEALSTDGERLFYVQGTEVYATSLDDPGTELESVDLGGSSNPAVVEACGDFVLVLYPGVSGSPSEVYFLDPDDLSSKYAGLARTLPVSTTHPSGAANGDVAAFVTGTTARIVEVFRPSAATSLTSAIQWGGGTSGAIQDLAIDDRAVYGTGTANDAADEVQAWPLDGTTTALWSASLPATAGTPTGNAIEADGERVFVGSDRVTTAAGSNRGLWCLDRITGELLWQAATAADVADIAVDDRFVYALSSGDVEVFDKATGAQIESVSASGASAYSACCDGVSLLFASGSSVVRTDRGRGSVKFQRVSGTEPGRAPFHNLATPV